MASLEPYIGSVDFLAFSLQIEDWAACTGDLIPVSQNQALYALIGLTYGGTSTVAFALPDLQGRVPVGVGQGAGLSAYELGEEVGTENHTMTIAEMPQHTHPVQLGPATSGAVSGYPAASGATTSSTLAPGATVLPAGQNMPFSIQQPSLALNPQIALEGIFPSSD